MTDLTPSPLMAAPDDILILIMKEFDSIESLLPLSSTCHRLRSVLLAYVSLLCRPIITKFIGIYVPYFKLPDFDHSVPSREVLRRYVTISRHFRFILRMSLWFSTLGTCFSFLEKDERVSTAFSVYLAQWPLKYAERLPQSRHRFVYIFSQIDDESLRPYHSEQEQIQLLPFSLEKSPLVRGKAWERYKLRQTRGQIVRTCIHLNELWSDPGKKKNGRRFGQVCAKDFWPMFLEKFLDPVLNADMVNGTEEFEEDIYAKLLSASQT